MIIDSEKYLIKKGASAREALRKLDTISRMGAVLFVIDDAQKIVGTLTDGDIRRGLLKNLNIDDSAELFAFKGYHYLIDKKYSKEDIKRLRNEEYKFVPVLDQNHRFLFLIDTYLQRGSVSASALIMAGGKGERLMPLTKDTPKPMLKVGDKPIIEHNIDRLIAFGIKTIYISVCYLKEQIMEYFGDGSSKGINIYYVEECEPLGTIGAASLIKNFSDECLIVMNSDLLTNVDFELLHDKMKEAGADMLVASVPYQVAVPFAVFELDDILVQSLQEKPTYTYHTNAGIYFLKKELLKFIPDGVPCNATDVMEKVINSKLKLIAEPIIGYWLDIGRIDDYKKAQEDFKYIQF
ncbi:MAG: nucleotidyltransferase family protein [Cytophagaceae bacterium]|nr:nucleotidyltransferase family protein [Cytophagaceae bacterium]